VIACIITPRDYFSAGNYSEGGRRDSRLEPGKSHFRYESLPSRYDSKWAALGAHPQLYVLLLEHTLVQDPFWLSHDLFLLNNDVFTKDVLLFYASPGGVLFFYA
jgi:hypothetical protein